MLHKRQPPQIPTQKKAPVNNWQRYEETMEHIKLARSTFESSGKLTNRETMLSNLIKWWEIEIRKLQQDKEK